MSYDAFTIALEEASMLSSDIENAVELIRMEYAEMPGLNLTFWQAQRLWNLSNEQCQGALAVLTGSGFLARTTDGAYVRRGGSAGRVERNSSLVRAV
jgi:hypothetical protein